TFAAGEAVRAVSFDLIGDRLAEADDEIVLTFSGAPAGVSVITDRATTHVIDDDVAPVAQDDAFTIDEDSVLTGNLLDDNGSGADTGGAPLSVSAVIAADGSELAVGQFHVFEFGSLRVN